MALAGFDLYCPPRNADRVCNFAHDLKQPSLWNRTPERRNYLEEEFLPLIIRVILALGEEHRLLAKNLAEPVNALIAVVEGIRLLVCSFRFQKCFPEGALKRFQAFLCDKLGQQQQILEQYGLAEMPPACEEVLTQGTTNSVMRLLADPLQHVVDHALPECEVQIVTGRGTKVDFPKFFKFFEACSSMYARWGRRGEAARRGLSMNLSYPAMFTPGELCARSGAGLKRGNEGPHVVPALKKLEKAGVKLSNFVINLGAGDGECHDMGTHNADPANCLAQSGSAAVMFEGSRRQLRKLAKWYGNRTDVAVVPGYITPWDLTSTLRSKLQSMYGASKSPDLLKIDVDHADCIFMEAALRVVQPKLIFFEILPVVPPPMEYVQDYQPRKLENQLPYALEEWTTSRTPSAASSSSSTASPSMASHFAKQTAGHPPPSSTGESDKAKPLEEPFGCSLQAFLTRAPEYDLLEVGAEDAILVRKDLTSVFFRKNALEEEARSKLGMELKPHSAAYRDTVTGVGRGGGADDAFVAWLEGSFCHPLRGLIEPSLLWGFDFRLLADLSLPCEVRAKLLDELYASRGATAYSLKCMPMPS